MLPLSWLFATGSNVSQYVPAGRFTVKLEKTFQPKACEVTAYVEEARVPFFGRVAPAGGMLSARIVTAMFPPIPIDIQPSTDSTLVSFARVNLPPRNWKLLAQAGWGPHVVLPAANNDCEPIEAVPPGPVSMM